MASNVSFKQEKLYSNKDVDNCLQSIVRPLTEHVYFSVDSVDPLETESISILIRIYFVFIGQCHIYYLEHHEYVKQLQNLSVSDSLACAACQVQFADRSEQVYT